MPRTRRNFSAKFKSELVIEDDSSTYDVTVKLAGVASGN